MQYSALKQITRANVSQLEVAWTFPVPDRKGNFGFNPLVVDSVMYVLGPRNAIVALDAGTGKQIWAHVPEGGGPGNRGINYWESRDRATRRLIFAAGGYLRALDALTGEPIDSFGNKGRVNMRDGAHRPLGGPSGTPRPRVRKPLHHGIQHRRALWLPAGRHPRLRRHHREAGMDLPHDSAPRRVRLRHLAERRMEWAGGANAWGEISIDEKRGIAYFPLGSPTHDIYGGDRKGANLFGNCLLALDARTGKRLWHFQVVHHDLWDYDLTTAPKLLTVRHNGKPVDIVAQPTKFGFLYVFDRVTGAPIWPIEERPVPKSDVPGRRDVADAALPHQSAAVRAADAHRRRHQSAPGRGGTPASEGPAAERPQRRPVHAADSDARPDFDPR